MLKLRNYEIEFYRQGVRIGRAEPYSGFWPNAEHLALRKGRSSGADFVRVLDDGIELWSERLDSSC